MLIYVQRIFGIVPFGGDMEPNKGKVYNIKWDLILAWIFIKGRKCW